MRPKSERFIDAIHEKAMIEYKKQIKEAEIKFSNTISLARERYTYLINQEYISGERKISISKTLSSL